MKTIAIVQTKRNLNLADALKQHIGKQQRAEFVTVTSQLDIPAGAEMGGHNLPQFVAGNRPVIFHNVGTAYDKNDTPEQRTARYAVLNDPDSTVQEILPVLGWVEELLIIPAKAYSEIKTQLTEARLNISEANTDEELLAAYKAGFNALKDVFLATKAPAPQAAPEAPIGDDEAPL